MCSGLIHARVCRSHSRVAPAAELLLLKTRIATKALEFLTTGFSFPFIFMFIISLQNFEAAQVTPQEVILLEH